MDRVRLFIAASAILLLVGASKASEVTLMLSPADPSRMIYEQLAAKFSADHPDIHFRIIWSDISQKMYLLAAADALPDLILLPHFQLINYDNQLLDLDESAESAGIDFTAFYPQLFEQCRHEGRLKMLPLFYNVPLLYYRPDLFRVAGAPVPNNTWTWKEYRDAARRLTRRDDRGNVEIWGTTLEQGWWVEWLGIIRQAGGDLLDEHGRIVIGSPATATAIHFLHDLIYVDRSAPRPDQAPAGGFMSGRYAMEYGGHVDEWLTLRREANFEWDIAPLPAGPAGRATGEFAVAGIGIWKHAKDPAAALQVLNFLTSRESGLAFCRSGRPPVRKDVAEAAFFTFNASDPRHSAPLHRKALIETLTFAHSTPRDKNFTPLALNYVSPLLQKALNNPDPAGIDAIPAIMQRDCEGYANTLAQKKSASGFSFAVEVILVLSAISGAIALLTRRGNDLKQAVPRGTNRLFFLFIMPWIIGMLWIVLGPMVLSFYWSHTDYNIVDPARFVGLAQYQSLLTQDPYFWHSLKITFIYALMSVPSSLALALVTAMLLKHSSPGIGLFRTLFYLPSILPVAASGIMWAWFLSPRWGLINRVLALVGIQGPGWLYDAKWALPSLVIIGLWGYGAPMVIFLAGLKNIPVSQYEAASVDGASRWMQFLHVTLPALSPVIFFNLTMGIIGALQIFDIAYVVGSAGPGIGEPQKSTYFYVLNLFDKAFINLNIGVGSAMAWVLFVIILAITATNFGLKRFWVFSEGTA